MKEEIQCRMLWKKNISYRKIHSWPYTLSSLAKHFCSTSWVFVCLSAFALFSGGGVDVASQFAIILPCRIWLETMGVLLATEASMHYGHRWMHRTSYFLHRRHHHEQKQDLTMEGSLAFDNLDLVIEFFAGMLLMIAAKWLLGLAPTIHFFSYSLLLILGMQFHSANPHAVYFFNPILDHFMRPTVCHNLHHFVQVGYYTQIPFHQLFNRKARENDIALYNQHMNTQYPLDH